MYKFFVRRIVADERRIVLRRTKKIGCGFLAVFLGLFLCFFAACGTPEQDRKEEEKFDATKLPFYEEEIDTLTYSYTEEERVRPFWQGNVIYNEQLMITEKDGTVQGKLLYTPERILSVRDWKLETEYVEGVDYLIDGNVITLPEGSSIPVFKDEWSRCENVPSQYPEGNAGSGYQMLFGQLLYTESSLIWSNYIHVTYVYDPEDVDRSHVSEYSPDMLYGLTEKIAQTGSDKPLKFTLFGDSISEGCSASKVWGHAPYCPAYGELVQYGLERFGGFDVTFTNLSVGGKDSTWAAEEEQLNDLMATESDFVIIAFGTNDSFANLDGNAYRSNIEKIVKAAKTANPECQILLIAPFPSNELSKSKEMHQKVCSTLKAISEETEYLDVGYLSMYEGAADMLEVKNYYEIAGNNVNHPNDFLHRFYAMNILNAIFDFNTVG